jgi:hypothetical protein
VRDAGVRVDHLRGALRVLGVDLRRHEHRREAERARVEDRRDLADDPLVDQVLDAAHDLVLAHLGRACDARVRARLERESALHEVEELLVELVERDGGAVLAASRLGLGYWSQVAASFAW